MNLEKIDALIAKGTWLQNEILSFNTEIKDLFGYDLNKPLTVLEVVALLKKLGKLNGEV